MLRPPAASRTRLLLRRDRPEWRRAWTSSLVRGWRNLPQGRLGAADPDIVFDCRQGKPKAATRRPGGGRDDAKLTRHCERSEAIHEATGKQAWIASLRSQ